METFTLIMFLIGCIGVVITSIIVLIKAIRKKECKKELKLTGIFIILVIAAITLKPTPKPEKVVSNTNKSNTSIAIKEEPKKEEVKKEEVKKEESKKEAVGTKRNAQGEAIDLGAGDFTVGTDIKKGVYDATTAGGQGNFIINTSKGTLLTNEVLGADDFGVKKVRIVIGDGDVIKISNINKVHFEPVTSDLIKDKQEVILYSGYWAVGQDIGAGRYKAGENLSATSNFIVHSKSGKIKTNEIISSSGDLGVKEVTVNLEEGDIIQISSSNGISFKPQ